MWFKKLEDKMREHREEFVLDKCLIITSNKSMHGKDSEQ